MTMPTVEEIRDSINKTLPAKISGKSFISELGAQPISPDITKLCWPVVGFPGLTFEGQAKPSTSVSVGEADVVRGKLIHMVRFTDEFADNQRGQEFLAATVASMATSFGPALDVVTTHGVDPKTGVKSASIAHSIVGDGTEAPITPGTPDDEVLDGLISAAEDATGVAISPQVFKGLAAQRTASGVKLFPEITPFADFPFGWVRARTSDQVAYPGDKRTVADSKVRAIAGVWADIARAATVSSVQILEAGNPDGGLTDLGSTNEKVLRIELHFAYAIRDAQNFVYATAA